MISGLISPPLVRYVMMAALRDRLLLSLGLVLLVGAALALFLGSGALVEADRFSLVFAAGGLRFAGVAGLVLFVAFHMRRAFDSKDIDFLLSRPVSRTGFIFSHALAFSLLALMLGLAGGAVLLAVNPASIGPGHLLWVASFAAELIIVVNATLFFSMVVSSASGSVLAVFGLYVLARLMGQLLGIAATDSDMRGWEILRTVMDAVSMVVPRLDLMAQTSWLVYPDMATGIGYGFILAQAVLYTALLVCAAVIDLRRRQF